MRYFTTTVIPDVINGDVSDVVGTSVHASDSGDVAMGSGDVLFDWTAFNIPKGACRLESISLYIMGEDGGGQNLADISLIFGKSENGEAPTALATAMNIAQDAGFDMPTHFIGATKLEGSGAGIGNIVGPAFGTIYVSNSTNGHGHVNSGLILEGEPESGTNVGYDTIYIAAYNGSANIDFSTGCKPDAQATTSTDTISVDGTDARKCFQVGDTIYTNTDDTALGTVKSVAETSIVLNANLAAQVEDNEEIVNANPIRIVMGFSK